MLPGVALDSADPVRDAIASLVLCTEVVEHVPDDHRLHRVRRTVLGARVLGLPGASR